MIFGLWRAFVRCTPAVWTELSKTSEGQERLGRAKDRLDIRVAEIGQAEIDKESGEPVNFQEPHHEDINENTIALRVQGVTRLALALALALALSVSPPLTLIVHSDCRRWTQTLTLTVVGGP